MTRIVLPACAAAALLTLGACSEPAKTSAKTDAETVAKPAGPPEAVTAKTAFWELYKPARSWATDLTPISVVSGEVPGVKNEAGKAGLWKVVFVSPGRRQIVTYTYAVADALPETHKGIKAGNVQAWGGATTQVMPFPTSDWSVDSDAAYTAAFEKAKDWVKKNPGKAVPTLSLGNASRFPAPVWYILWGSTKSGYAAYVNASSGKVIGK